MSARIPLAAFALAVFVHSLWGANPVAVKFGLTAFGPLTSAFLRFALGTLFVLAVARVMRVRIWPQPGEWPSLVLIGVLFTVQIGLMNTGFDRTSASLGAILIASNPLFAALGAHLLIEGDRMNRVKACGLAAAFLGVAAVLSEDLRAGQWTPAALGNVIVLASAALLGFRLAISARVLRQIDEVRVAVWQMVISMPLFAVGGALFETVHWDNVGWTSLGGIAYQGFVIAGFGFVVSFALMKRYAPSVMMSFNFVSPLAGVILGAWLLSEPLTASVIIGLGLVAGGLYLIAASVR